jgi:hypothetical protein
MGDADRDEHVDGRQAPRGGRFMACAWTLGALSFALLGTGCGGATAAQSPDDVVAAFARALRTGRATDAWALMSADYRRRVSEAEFARHLAENPAEAREAADALARPDGRATQRAELTLADGDRVVLVRDDGDWRIATNLADFYDQSTPRAALRSFVRAMERERYDVVLRFVPDADREGMTEARMREAFSVEGRDETARLLAALRAGLDAPVEEVGDHATLRYGEDGRRVARLRREDGLWKIEDPDE